jgi:hypothetical protein
MKKKTLRRKHARKNLNAEVAETLRDFSPIKILAELARKRREWVGAPDLDESERVARHNKILNVAGRCIAQVAKPVSLFGVGAQADDDD